MSNLNHTEQLRKLQETIRKNQETITKNQKTFTPESEDPLKVDHLDEKESATEFI